MDVVTYALLNKKIKGLISGVKSVSVQGHSIIFELNDGSTQTMTFDQPADGVSITDVDVDTDKHLIVTFSDGNTIDAGEIPTVKGDKGDKGEKGDTGFSPTITENPDNTNEIYKLDVTNEDGTFTTPNLKGTGGGLDPDKYYDKAQIDTLVEPLAEAKHTHDNKDTVLDKLTTNDAGDTLLFNGNAIKGSVEIDDTTTEATDKVWSTKKTNDTFEEVKQSITDTNAKFADYDTSAEVDGKITTALADYEKSVDVNTKITTALQDYDKSDVIDSKITTALADYEKSVDVDTKLAEYDKSTVVNKKITDALADYDTSEVVDNKLIRYAENKNMTGATASANGTAGLVPLPEAGTQTKFLRGDGTWQVPDIHAMITGLQEAITTPTDNDFYVGQYTNGGTEHPVYFRRKMSNLWAYIKTKLTNATTSANGLMSASDKTKLDGVATGATKNQVCTFTIDIAVSDWGADSNGGYSCTKTITGVLATDIPEVDVVLSTDRAAAMTQLAALECLCDGTVITGDDTVKLWCYNNKPTVAITVRLKVVR